MQLYNIAIVYHPVAEKIDWNTVLHIRLGGLKIEDAVTVAKCFIEMPYVKSVSMFKDE